MIAKRLAIFALVLLLAGCAFVTQEELLTRQIKARPSDRLLYKHRGILYCNEGQLEKCIGDLNMATSLGLHDRELFRYRGKAYLDRGYLDKALSDFNTAVKMDPNDPLSFQYRAPAYFLNDECGRAWQDLLKAERLGATVDRVLKDDVAQCLRRELGDGEEIRLEPKDKRRRRRP